MKLLTSSSLDPSLCHSKSATVGCLTAILRRILCSGNLQTNPSYQIRELDSISKMSGKVQEFKTKQNTESYTTTTTTTTITPGLVERLMGLESIETTIEATSSSSLSRSKSMNYLGECKQMEGLHLRAKSSSFREVPTTFHLLENENFLVLSFESGCCDGGEFRSKGRKNEKGLRGECKKNKREKVHDEKGNLSDMSSATVGSDGEHHKLHFSNTSTLFMACSEKEYFDSETKRFSHPVKRKEVDSGGKVKRRKKATTCYAEKKVDTECSSEDSSPVSIFDFERQALGTEVGSFGVGMSWRRKLSPELEDDQLYVLYCESNLMIEEMKVNTIDNNKNEESKRKEKQSKDCVDIWGEICRLVEDELGSNKLEEGLRKQGDFGSVCADFESEIFDHVLDELIDQLVGNPLKALQLQHL